MRPDGPSTPLAFDHRVAVLGGDGRLRPGLIDAPSIVYYKSPRDGGNGDARRLASALRGGGIGTLIVLTRWNSHATTRKLTRLCKLLGVEVVAIR